jgi:hypothetical protein
MADNLFMAMLPFIISYAIIIFGGWFLINFLSNGFFNTFILVKASRGKKVLVKLHSTSYTYFKIGEIAENILTFKDNNKQNPNVTCKVTRDQLYKAIGVNCIDYSEETKNILSPNGSVESGVDVKRFEELLIRALMKPKIEKSSQSIFWIIMVIGVGVGLCLYMIYELKTDLRTVIDVLNQLKSMNVIK